jgi:predicted Co/Zn/Cd cation transporter (cation efflux family)
MATMTIVCLVLTGCLLATGSNYVAVPGDNNSLLMEDGITVQKLTKAIHIAVENNSKDLTIKAESSSKDKTTVWLYSKKLKQEATVYVTKKGEKVFLGVTLGHNRQSREKNAQDIYYIQDVIEKNITN